MLSNCIGDPTSPASFSDTLLIILSLVPPYTVIAVPFSAFDNEDASFTAVADVLIIKYVWCAFKFSGRSPSSLIILDPYSIDASYRVGFDVSEEIINSNDDSSLYDNAKGFTNFAAPGADRFKISVKLAK